MENQLRTYETILITKVDMPEDKFNTLVERSKNAILNEGKGSWIYTDDLGKAKIAYPIEKDSRGKWTYMRYKSLSTGVDEIQRGLRINEYVLRQLTVRVADDGADYEPIRENLAKDIGEREKMREWKDDRRERFPRRDGGGGYGRHDRHASGNDDNEGSFDGGDASDGNEEN
jgi:small subunit ribosomal protein S6